MKPPHHPLRYLALLGLMLLLAGVGYVAGKTPGVVRRALVEVQRELKEQHSIDATLKNISVDGFLTIRADDFELTKKDLGLRVRSKAIKARLSPWSYLTQGNPISRLEIDTPEVEARLDADWGTGDATNFKLPFGLDELVILNGHAKLLWKNRVFEILKLDTRANIMTRRVNIRKLILEMPEGKFIAEGKVGLANPAHPGLGSDLRIWLQSSLQKVPEIQKTKTPFEADIDVQGRVQFKSIHRGPEYYGLIAAKAIRLDDVRIHALRGSVVVNPKLAELKRIEVDFAGSKPVVQGKLYFDKELHFDTVVSGKNISLYALLEDLDVKKPWTQMKFNTVAKAKGQVFPRFSLKGTATGKTDILTVHDTTQLILQTENPIKFELDLEADEEAFRFKKARFWDGWSSLIADCDLYFKKPGMWLKTKPGRFDFRSIKNQIVTEKFQGVGVAEVSIDGPYEHLLIKAPVQMKDFQFNQFQFGELTGNFEFSENQIYLHNAKGKQHSLFYTGDVHVDLESTPTVVGFEAKVEQGLAQDLRAYVLQELEHFDWTGPIRGSIKLEGPFEKGYRHKLTGFVTAELLAGGDIMGAGVKSGVGRAVLDGESARLEQAHLETSQGTFEVSGVFNKNSETGQGVLSVKESQIGEAELNLKVEEGRLLAKGLLFESKTYVDATVDLEEHLPYTAAVSMPYGSVRGLFRKIPWLEEYQVSAAIRGQASGQLEHVENSKASLTVFPASFYLGSLRFLAPKALNLEYAQRRFSLKETLFQSVYDDKIELKGSLSKADLDAQLKAKGDLWMLTHIDNRVEGAYGAFGGDVHMKGVWGSVSYEGEIQISPDSYVSLRDYPPGLTQLKGNIKFEGSRGNIQISGKASNGNFDLTGGIELSRSMFDPLRLELRKMPVYYSTYLTGTTNGHLLLEGPFSDPTLSGDLKFSEVLFTKELEPTEFKAPRSRAKKQSIKLNVGLSSESPVKIESKSFNGELVGNLILTGNTNALGLLGEVSVNSGDIYFRNQHYQIIKARANFDNPFRIAPNIDVEANAQILDYDVTVHAQGEFSRPKLFFSSRPSLAQNDLVSLVSFGFTSREYRDSLGVAQSAGLEALSMYSGIGTQVLKAIPGTAFDELRLGTLYSPIGGGATPSVVIGMQVLGKMRLRFQTGLVTNLLGNREKKLELEKYINKNWRWRASWNSEGITNYGDAGVDLWFRWDY